MLQFSSPISHFKFIKSGCFVIPPANNSRVSAKQILGLRSPHAAAWVRGYNSDWIIFTGSYCSAKKRAGKQGFEDRVRRRDLFHVRFGGSRSPLTSCLSSCSTAPRSEGEDVKQVGVPSGKEVDLERAAPSSLGAADGSPALALPACSINRFLGGRVAPTVLVTAWPRRGGLLLLVVLYRERFWGTFLSSVALECERTLWTQLLIPSEKAQRCGCNIYHHRWKNNNQCKAIEALHRRPWGVSEAYFFCALAFS